MHKDTNTKQKKFTFDLTNEEISIIKAGLQYFWLADDYGYALWGTMLGASFGSSDIYYRVKVGELYEKLGKLSKIKPDYGWWGNINRITKLCMEDFKIAKRKGEEAERIRANEVIILETIEEHLKKLGIDGSVIVSKAYQEACKKIEDKEIKK